MKIILIIIYFLFFCIKISNNIYIDPAWKVIDKLNTYIYSSSSLDKIKTNLIDVLDNFYAYNTILNNPPQPPFNPNYHSRIDLSYWIRRISTRNTSLYKFYHNFTRIIAKTKDSQLYFNFKRLSHITKFVVFSPIQLNMKMDINGKERMYGSPFVDETMQKYFRNYQQVFKTIKNNLDKYILSINGKDPFEYILNYGKSYLNLRNQHGEFTIKYSSFNRFPLSIMPFSAGEVQNFTDKKDSI